MALSAPLYRLYEHRLQKNLPKDLLPSHVGVILDGHRRFARSQGHTDYTESYVDVTMPMSAQVTLDGVGLPTAPTAISSGYGIARVPLGAGVGGAHLLTSTAPVGIQVIGYGNYTSYMYPGGLNLNAIAPPPPPPT